MRKPKDRLARFALRKYGVEELDGLIVQRRFTPALTASLELSIREVDEVLGTLGVAIDVSNAVYGLKLEEGTYVLAGVPPAQHL